MVEMRGINVLVVWPLKSSVHYTKPPKLNQNIPEHKNKKPSCGVYLINCRVITRRE